MLPTFIKNLVSKNNRDVNRLRPYIDQINKAEASMLQLSLADLRIKTLAWKTELSEIKDSQTLADRLHNLLPEAFAVIKLTCKHLVGTKIDVCGQELTWNMVPFDVQLLGGCALHFSKVAEMATGEGKTLVAVLPTYLNALTGRGVHVVTVNDYLALRDSSWMGTIYKALGLTVGCLLQDQTPKVRKDQYLCDITYGTNSEFGFDYLRDNGTAMNVAAQVQRGHYFALIDEADSVLIDEARTPLIISDFVPDNSQPLYSKLHPTIIDIVVAQTKLCQEKLDKVAKLLAQSLTTKQVWEEIGTLLYQVKLGTPRSIEFLHFLENKDCQKWLHHVELLLHAERNKKEKYAQKEELFYVVDEKENDADLTEKGRTFLNPNDPNAFVIPDMATALYMLSSRTDLTPADKKALHYKLHLEFASKAQVVHITSQLIKAYSLYQKDIHYVVQNDKVIIVDINTGRMMPDRRWNDGLHQAIEAKESVTVAAENQTMATITIQNYFRLYQKLAGMTGTAETEAAELLDIYGLDVLVIPTHKPLIRKDGTDSIYKTVRDKYSAVLAEIRGVHATGRPILIGTVSVRISEQLSGLLTKVGIPHAVLNAKFHQQEAEIVAKAGQLGAVTIATNMAGRGTDIKLGKGVVELGGLHVIGTERHEARRIDRQLRGRCARQGDPGSSHVFVSLEDNLMRLFGSDKLFEFLTLDEGQALTHPIISKAIEQAQKRVERQSFKIRKHTLDYDNVINKQREVIFALRNNVLTTSDFRKLQMDIVEALLDEKLDIATSNPNTTIEFALQDVLSWVCDLTGIQIPIMEIDLNNIEVTKSGILTHINTKYSEFTTKVLETNGNNVADLLALERVKLLYSIDTNWREHLYEMETLRQSTDLRAHGQKDPLTEYKSEAFKMFTNLMNIIKSSICENLVRLTPIRT